MAAKSVAVQVPVCADAGCCERDFSDLLFCVGDVLVEMILGLKLVSFLFCADARVNPIDEATRDVSGEEFVDDGSDGKKTVEEGGEGDRDGA